MEHLTTIGRAERVDLPDFGLKNIPAKVDTGADSSSLWVSSIKETSEGLQFILFGPSSPYYTGDKVMIAHSKYHLTRVVSSFGHKEYRYKVKLRLYVKGRLIRATITLANRSNKTYPILLGRRMLHNKFIVDVSKGMPLIEAEKKRREKMKSELHKINDKLGA